MLLPHSSGLNFSFFPHFPTQPLSGSYFCGEDALEQGDAVPSAQAELLVGCKDEPEPWGHHISWPGWTRRVLSEWLNGPPVHNVIVLPKQRNILFQI